MYKLFFVIFFGANFIVGSDGNQQSPLFRGLLHEIDGRGSSLFGQMVSTEWLDPVASGDQNEGSRRVFIRGTEFGVQELLVEILGLQQDADNRQAWLVQKEIHLRAEFIVLSECVQLQGEQIARLHDQFVRLQDQLVQEREVQLQNVNLLRRLEEQCRRVEERQGNFELNQSTMALHIQELSARVQKLEQSARSGKK